MATGPRLFLGFTLVVLAATLTLLWQAFGPRPAPPTQSVTRTPTARTPAAPAVPAPAPAPEEPAVRSVYPGLGPSAAKPPEAPASAAAPPSPETQSAVLQPSAPPPAVQEQPTDAVEMPAGEVVDLNTGSVEQLNELGAGMIGRHIAANRPYASPDELLSKRILNRRDFETIRPRVVAR